MRKYEYTSKKVEWWASSASSVYISPYSDGLLSNDKFNKIVSGMDDEGWEFVGLDTTACKAGITSFYLLFRKPYTPEVGTELEIQLKSQERVVW